jgi:hypothetical protein
MVAGGGATGGLMPQDMSPYDVRGPGPSGPAAPCERCGAPGDKLLGALRRGLSQAAGPRGPLSRAEYGYFMLAMLVAWSALFCALLSATEDLAVSALVGLAAVALPVVTASVRRVHDAAKSRP